MAAGDIRLEVDAAVRKFHFHEGNLRQLLRGPNGAVARDLVRRAVRVEAAAKENATHRPGPRVRSGRLRDSITYRLGEDEKGLFADIGSAVLYAPYLEYGTSRMPAYPYLRPALNAA